MKILVFVSSNCPHCPNAERVVREVVPDYQDNNLSYRKIRMKTSEGKSFSMRYNIMSTPTILFIDEKDYEIKRIVGTPSEGNLRKLIERLLGLKKSFFGNLFNKKTDNL